MDSNIAESLLSFISWVESAGSAGWLIYIIFLAAVVALSLPIVGALEVVPGFIFGFPAGLFVSVVGKNLGNVFALALAGLARRRVRRWLGKLERFRVVERMVQRGGFLPIIVIRLIYMPMALKNYSLGIMDVPKGKVLLAGFVSGFPFAIMWTYIGTTAKDLVEILDGRKAKLDVPWQVTAGFGCVGLLFVRRLYKWVKAEWDSALAEVKLETEKRKAR